MSTADWQPVIGLEVHVQLATRSKIFAYDHNTFGAEPNVNLGAVTIAHPGTLPIPSREVFDMALKVGVALECEINRQMVFDRKNYFYPDLPKGYQITQDTTPICVGGGLTIELGSGEKRHISLTKIHLEEDAGKSIHEKNVAATKVDLNRAGVPLIEIVTDPIMSTSEEAGEFLTEIRKIVRYLGISDGNMEQGSLRCDANVSLHRPGKPLGSKVEVKNMNSIKNVRKAIDIEIERQKRLLESGEDIISETRTFSLEKKQTFGMRDKENLNDYRYFPEPDISPVLITQEWLDAVKAGMPRLPFELRQELEEKYGLPVYDAGVLTEDQSVVDYFMQVAAHCQYFKSVSNWMMGPVKSILNELKLSIKAFAISPKQLAQVVNMVEEGQLTYTNAAQKLWPALVSDPALDPQKLAHDMGLIFEKNDNDIRELVKDVLSEHPEKVKAYKKGKKGLVGMFMGELMKKTAGKVDPKEANRTIIESLEEIEL